MGVAALGSYDPAWAIDATGHFYVYDVGDKGASTGTVSSGVPVMLACVRESTGANGTHYYIDGRYDRSVTHADSIAAAVLAIGADRPTVANPYSGTMQQVAMFVGCGLSASEVAYLYAHPYALITRDDSLAAWAAAIGGGAPATGNPWYYYAQQEAVA